MARQKGSKNRVTSELREVVTQFLDQNLDKMQKWLDQIEEQEGPLEAFKRLEAILEYSIPKLQRTEVTGKDGGALNINIIRYADNPDT